MRVLAFGQVEDSMEKSLKKNRVVIETMQGNLGMEEMFEWVRADCFDAILINKGGKWNSSLVERMRTEGIITPVIGLGDAKFGNEEKQEGIENDEEKVKIDGDEKKERRSGKERRSEENIGKRLNDRRGDERRKQSEERAMFLESGGDDYLCYPISERELLATLRATTRRFKGSLSDRKVFVQAKSIITFDCATGQLTVNGKEVKLTFREKKLVELLSVTSPRIQTKEKILEYLYPYGDEPSGIGNVEVFINKIRKKLKMHCSDAVDVIETVWGQGYRMVSE